MEIRPATPQDNRAIAELALMAGEGIPAYFWAQSQQAGDDILDVGARNLLSETDNFSYRNVHVAVQDNQIVGMMLSYRLPPIDQTDDLNEYPEFIRPLVELEQCVPDSYYINMLAVYPGYRNKGVGRILMAEVDTLAKGAGCTLSSIEVFEENSGALKLYQRLGYRIIESRPVIPHSSHPYQGNILLLVKEVN